MLEFDILIKFFKLVFSFLIDHHQDKLLVGGDLDTSPGKISNIITELYSDNPQDVTSSNTGSSSSNPVGGDKSPTRGKPTIIVEAPSGDPMEVDPKSPSPKSPSQEEESLEDHVKKEVQKLKEDRLSRRKEKLLKGEIEVRGSRSRSRGKGKGKQAAQKKVDNLAKNLDNKFKKDNPYKMSDVDKGLNESLKDAQAAKEEQNVQKLREAAQNLRDEASKKK